MFFFIVLAHGVGCEEDVIHLEVNRHHGATQDPMDSFPSMTQAPSGSPAYVYKLNKI